MAEALESRNDETAAEASEQLVGTIFKNLKDQPPANSVEAARHISKNSDPAAEISRVALLVGLVRRNFQPIGNEEGLDSEE